MRKSKAQAVRKYITKNPDAPLREVCEATKTSYAYVCTIKGKMKKDEKWVTALVAASNAAIDITTGATPEEMKELVFKATQEGSESEEIVGFCKAGNIFRTSSSEL